jgi:hypothetical protein
MSKKFLATYTKIGLIGCLICILLTICVGLTGCGSGNSIEGSWRKVGYDTIYTFNSDGTVSHASDPDNEYWRWEYTWSKYSEPSANVEGKNYSLYIIHESQYATENSRDYEKYGNSPKWECDTYLAVSGNDAIWIYDESGINDEAGIKDFIAGYMPSDYFSLTREK